MNENLENLVLELIKYPTELPWLEFKHNNYTPVTIGQDISALANGATLENRHVAYFLWGIDDTTHEIVGTEFNLQNLKKGEQELENWLRGLLSPNADFEYQPVTVSGKMVGVLTIQPAANQPVAFEKTHIFTSEVIQKNFRIILHCKQGCGTNSRIIILRISQLERT